MQSHAVHSHIPAAHLYKYVPMFAWFSYVCSPMSVFDFRFIQVCNFPLLHIYWFQERVGGEIWLVDIQ